MRLMVRWMLLGIGLLFLALPIILFTAQDKPHQIADADFDTRVAKPQHVGTHPRLLIDQAHRNIHTLRGLYRPFARLAKSDGYDVVAGKDPFTASSLQGVRILVIANALGSNDANDGPAFTEAESDAVRDWVRAGGSLLLVTDHFPTGAAAKNLAARFGVGMTAGMTEDPEHHDPASDDASQLVFSRDNGLLGEHPVTRGRDASGTVNRVVTFTGQSLEVPAGAVAFLRLADSAVDRRADARVEKDGGDTRVIINYGEPVSAAGRAQAVAIEFGQGRVIVLGEAAMITAQLDGESRKPFGMNTPGVDNRQLVLNLLHWLSRDL